MKCSTQESSSDLQAKQRFCSFFFKCRTDEYSSHRRETLTSLRTSGDGSWGLRHAWATLMTCSSFLGCSSTFAARKSAAGEITWGGGDKLWLLFPPVNKSLKQNGFGHENTYISVKSGEGLDHVEAMHVHDGCVNGKLGAVTSVKDHWKNCAILKRHRREFC